MSKITITTDLSDEKLKALNRYLSKKNETLDDKLSEQLAKLYTTIVPVQVREFLDEGDVVPPKPKAPARPAKPVTTKSVEVQANDSV